MAIAYSIEGAAAAASVTPKDIRDAIKAKDLTARVHPSIAGEPLIEKRELRRWLAGLPGFYSSNDNRSAAISTSRITSMNERPTISHMISA